MWKVTKLVKDSKTKVKDMELNRETAWDVYEKLKEILGIDEFLEALARALGTDELIDNMKFIIRTYDINLDDEIKDSCGKKKSTAKDACGNKKTSAKDDEETQYVYTEEGEPDFGLDVLNFLYKNHKDIKYIGESTYNGKTYLRFDKLPDDVKAALKEEFGDNISFTVAHKKNAPEIEYPVIVVRSEEVNDACGKKPATKDAKIKDFLLKMNLDEFEPWSGAVDTWDKIIDNDKLDDFDRMLEEIYPDGLEITGLNDLLWFDADWVLESLGLAEETEDDEENEDEE